MAQQTAVEWLVKMLYSPVCNGFINGNRRTIPHDIVEQAKQMEKEQAFQNFKAGQESMEEVGKSFDQYYNKK